MSKKLENNVKKIIKIYVGIEKDIPKNIIQNLLIATAQEMAMLIEIVGETKSAETFEIEIRKDLMEKFIQKAIQKNTEKLHSLLPVCNTILEASKKSKIEKFYIVVDNLIRTVTGDITKTIKLSFKQKDKEEKEIIDLATGNNYWISIFYLYAYLYDCLLVEYKRFLDVIEKFVIKTTEEIIDDIPFIDVLTQTVKTITENEPENYEIFARIIASMYSDTFTTVISKARQATLLLKAYRKIIIDIINAWCEIYPEKIKVISNFALPLEAGDLPPNTLIEKIIFTKNENNYSLS